MASDQIDALLEELVDRFGKLPPQAQTLVDLHRLRVLTQPYGVVKVDTAPGVIQITFKPPRVHAFAPAPRPQQPQAGHAPLPHWTSPNIGLDGLQAPAKVIVVKHDRLASLFIELRAWAISAANR